MVDERYTLKGYKLKTWLFKNKESIKLIASGTVGLITAAISGLPPTWSTPLGALVAVGSKLLIDAIDYWQSP